MARNPIFARRIKFEPLRSLSYADITTSYVAVGSATENPAHVAYISNITNGSLLFSFDGMNNHLIIPANGYFLLDISTNKVTQEGFWLAEGTTLYVKQFDTPTTGFVSFSLIYGDTQ